MTRYALPLAAIAALIPVAPAVARPACPAKAGSTVERTSQARIWTQRSDGRQRWYGCHRSKGRRVLLHSAPAGRTDTFRQARLAGRYAAFARREADGATRVRVFDLVARKLLRQSSFTATANSLPSQARVTDLVLAPDGGVAWIVHGIYDGGIHEVRALDAEGERLVDTGAIDPVSLKLVGQTVTWAEGDRLSATPLD